MQCLLDFSEILRQVWDLSDQDNDSMLSLREFCISLYLMERYREGRPPPPVLPTSIMLDEAMAASGQPTAVHSGAAWRHTPGMYFLFLPFIASTNSLHLQYCNILHDLFLLYQVYHNNREQKVHIKQLLVHLGSHLVQFQFLSLMKLGNLLNKSLNLKFRCLRSILLNNLVQKNKIL